MPTTDSNRMKTTGQAHGRKNQPPHLAYRACCLPPRVRTASFFKLTTVIKNPNSLCPVKQTRALLKSNPPRDNWTEGDEINRLHIWGPKSSPNVNLQTFISEPSHALENFQRISRSEYTKTEQTNKNTLSWCPFFRGKRTSLGQPSLLIVLSQWQGLAKGPFDGWNSNIEIRCVKGTSVHKSSRFVNPQRPAKNYVTSNLEPSAPQSKAVRNGSTIPGKEYY